MCCVCKSCIVFALLPVQCDVCVSPVLCLDYCHRSVLCEDYNKSFVVFAQCTGSSVCRAGAVRSPLIILFCYFYYFYPFPLVGSG